MEQEDFERSTGRAHQARTYTWMRGLVTKDFKLVTRKPESGRVRWHWLPMVQESVMPIWNPDGGPALSGYLKKTYWLCMGWSRMELLESDDPRTQCHTGGQR